MPTGNFCVIREGGVDENRPHRLQLRRRRPGGAWSADWAWALPLIGLTVIIHLLGLGLLSTLVSAQGVRCRMKGIGASLRPRSALLLTLLFFPGCNALNPLCGSARPVPVIGSLSPTTITFAEVQQGFLLTVNGSQFVSSSVVVINGTMLSTTVVSSQQLQVTITTTLISGPGTASVTVSTPSGNSGDVGCSSGGTSSALVLTIN